MKKTQVLIALSVLSGFAISAAAPAASTDSRDFIVGISVPFGPHTFLASYIHKDDRNTANRDADKEAIGYFYTLSKRTSFYASYSIIQNKNGAAHTVASAIESGSGNESADVGIRHNF